jgi:hypothetical protein
VTDEQLSVNQVRRAMVLESDHSPQKLKPAFPRGVACINLDILMDCILK